MTGLIILVVYILGVPAWMWIEKIFFPYKEGDYTIDYDGAHEITPEIWKCDAEARACIWPICLAAIITILPIVLFDKIFEKL